MTLTILVIEDQDSDFVEFLEFALGAEYAAYYRETEDLPGAHLHAVKTGFLLLELREIIGSQYEIALKRYRNAESARKVLIEDSSIVLAVLDLDLDGEMSFGLFNSLVNSDVPVLVHSRNLNNDIWKQLYALANGKYFGVLTKGMLPNTQSTQRDQFAAKSLATMVAGLVLLHPRFVVGNKLRRLLGREFLGEDPVTAELVSTLYSIVPPFDYEAIYSECDLKARGYLRGRFPNTIDGSGVIDEVSALKTVVIHSPGDEIKSVDPDSCAFYLFNQPVSFTKYRRQHDKFRVSMTSALAHHRGTVYTVRELLQFLLSETVDAEYRSYLKARFLLSLLEGTGKETEFWDLILLKPDELIEFAFTGKKGDKKILDAIPNLVFTRDWGFVAHNRVFLSNMNKPARKRETVIAEFLFKYHPLFSDLFERESTLALMGDETVEGGDVMLGSSDTVIVGFSERTKFQAIQKFAKLAFKELKGVNKVIATSAPLLNPKSMHLDTFMGFLNAQSALVDETTFAKKNDTHFIFRRAGADDGGEQWGEQEIVENINGEKRGSGITFGCYLGSFVDCISHWMDKNWSPILIDDPNEQYDDALNTLAIAPNKVFIYERAERTIRKLTEEVEVKERWEKFEFQWTNSESVELTDTCKRHLKVYMEDATKRVLFIVEGDELALARGGPHCMTFPVWRLPQ